MPYVSERWLGGMLTNFRTIQTRIKRLKSLESGLESGDFASKYNKKEVLDLSNEAQNLQRIFGGIKDMAELPRAIFVVDMVRDNIAINEARNLGIPVIAICDTNSNPELVDYPVPANDDAIKSLRLITHQIADAAAAGAIEFGKKAAEAKAEPETETAAA
jgi:small subunit ribosomal protein S2